MVFDIKLERNYIICSQLQFNSMLTNLEIGGIGFLDSNLKTLDNVLYL